MAYPQYAVGELFEIYTNASSRQLGGVIAQSGKPLAFYSRKLDSAQQKYSVTELELLHSRMSKRIERHALGSKAKSLYCPQ